MIEKWLRKNFRISINIPFLRFYMDILWFDAWPDMTLGTKFWCFELLIGTPKRHFHIIKKLDFWRPITFEKWKFKREGNSVTTYWEE